MKKIVENYVKNDGIFSKESNLGYWSNFNEEDQKLLFEELKNNNAEKVIEENFPQYSRMIFDPSRCLGLELLEINKNQIGVDYGCMWGNMLLYSAKKAKNMVGIDQTHDSLKFVSKRLKDDKIDNTYLINDNLRNNIDLKNQFDFSIINGVLEWIPTREKVSLKTFFEKSFKKKVQLFDPREDQKSFLKMVNNNLKKDGKVYLSIENRYDYQHFLWKKDPHSGLMFTAYLPRFLANIYSKFKLGKSYVNYIYSKNQLVKLLQESNFKEIEVFAVFPDYRFPKKIVPLNKKFKNNFDLFPYEGTRSDFIARVFKKTRRLLDFIIFKKLNLYSLSPSFIIIAKKL
jgi:hypothetical protein